MKDREGVGFGFGGQFAGVDDFFDVREVAVFFLLGEIDAEFGGGHAFALGFEEAEGGVELEALKGGFESMPIGSGIKQSADSHVAADTGKDVEIAEGHGSTSVAREGTASRSLISQIFLTPGFPFESGASGPTSPSAARHPARLDTKRISPDALSLPNSGPITANHNSKDIFGP